MNMKDYKLLNTNDWTMHYEEIAVNDTARLLIESSSFQ